MGLKFEPANFDVKFIKKALDFATPQDDCVLIYRFEYAPAFLREFFNIGGDEEFIIICKGKEAADIIADNYLPGWIERLDSVNEPSIWILPGYIIIVPSH